MSSGTRDHQQVRRLPLDPAARAAFEAWMGGGPEATLLLDGLDCRGTDLSDAQVFETWAMGSDFRDSTFVGTDIEGARLYRADFRGCDLRRVVLANADAEGADFSGADLTDANLRSSDAPDAVFTAANLSGASLSGSWARADLRRAELTAVRFRRFGLRRAALCGATAKGASGSVIGPFVADVDGEERLVGGPEAEAWFAARGAEVEVLSVDEGVR